MLLLNADHISTAHNFIANGISWLESFSIDVSYALLQKYSQLGSCQIFHPSQELCSSLFTGLLVGAKVDYSRPKTWDTS